MGRSGTGLKFSITNCKSSKPSSRSLLKNMSKMFILDLNKKGFFSNSALYSNSAILA